MSKSFEVNVKSENRRRLPFVLFSIPYTKVCYSYIFLEIINCLKTTLSFSVMKKLRTETSNGDFEILVRR